MRRRRYVARALEARGIIDLVYKTNRLTTRRHPYATQENNNLLRWFHAYVIAHGSSALDAYDAFGARVQAQKMKEKSSTSRTPLKTQTTSPRDASGRGAVSDNADHSASIERERGAATVLSTPLASSSNAAHFSTPGLSGHLVPNDVAVVSEMERRTSGADEFAFSPAAEPPATPVAPRALTYDTAPATPQAFGGASGDRPIARARDADPSKAPARSTSGRRPLDRWATKARETLDARKASSKHTVPEHVYEEETTSTCCGCFIVSRKLTRSSIAST